MTKPKNAQAGSVAGKKERLEVRLSGFGGQGIVLAGNILGRSVVLFEGKNAVFTQSYGPEARGGGRCASLQRPGSAAAPHQPGRRAETHSRHGEGRARA